MCGGLSAVTTWGRGRGCYSYLVGGGEGYYYLPKQDTMENYQAPNSIVPRLAISKNGTVLAIFMVLLQTSELVANSRDSHTLVIAEPVAVIFARPTCTRVFIDLTCLHKLTHYLIF